MTEEDVLQHILDLLESSRKGRTETLKSLPRHLLYVWATYSVEAEVVNGGFDQYFYNTGGEFVSEAVEGFRAMEASGYADLVDAAAGVFHENYPKPRDEGNAKVPWYQRNHRRIQAFEMLDNKFMLLQRIKEPEAFRSEYIYQNRAAFRKVIHPESN